MKSVTQASNLEEFFVSKLDEALTAQKLSVSAEVHFYLVNLLTHYARSANLFSITPEGKIEYRALALRLHDAAFDRPEKRYLHLKNLGDTALYHAGVFYDGLFGQLVTVDYYINIGGSAYSSLANMNTHNASNPLADIFSELSDRFAQLVEILHLVCESEVANHDHDLLRLLERYQKTKSEKARTLLKEKGIDPDWMNQIKIVQ